MMPSFRLVQLTFLLMFLFMLTGCKDYDLNPFSTVLRYTIENGVAKNAVEDKKDSEVVYDE